MCVWQRKFNLTRKPDAKLSKMSFLFTSIDCTWSDALNQNNDIPFFSTNYVLLNQQQRKSSELSWLFVAYQRQSLKVRKLTNHQQCFHHQSYQNYGNRSRNWKKRTNIEHFCPKINIFHRIPSPEHFNFSKENPFFFCLSLCLICILFHFYTKDFFITFSLSVRSMCLG